MKALEEPLLPTNQNICKESMNMPIACMQTRKCDLSCRYLRHCCFYWERIFRAGYMSLHVKLSGLLFFFFYR